ncbi:MAG: aminomethyl transferase family protein [Desulfosarcinaceae bacterium]|nr:aminomethyl transferase family protein [Desulfosarcinaceae bacterium]
MTAPKKTPLHGWHVARGANMADFGGYEMPLWYSSVKNEHLAVLTGAGIFDTSHMAAVTVSGPDAVALLQHCFTNDLAACIGPRKMPLADGRCVYGAFLNAAGHVIDDAIVFQVSADDFFIVVNAGMGAQIAEHLEGHLAGRNAAVADLTDRVAKMDIQGPQAANILAQLLASPETVFDRLPYFSFKGHFDPSVAQAKAVTLTNGTPLLLSRTGYTGEFGFEIFIGTGQIETLWKMVLEVGGAAGLLPCGLAARDSLRAGAVLPLSHQDIGPWPFVNHPWPFALPYDDDGGFSKRFVGSEALLNATDAPHTLAFVGKDLRKVASGDDASGVYDGQGNRIGAILTCATDMGIGWSGGEIVSIASPHQPADFKPRGLSCGFVQVNQPLPVGETIELRDARRKIQVTITTDIRPDRTARKPMGQMWTGA